MSLPATPQSEPQRLRIAPVQNRRERRLFLRLPEAIYRDDPAWVAPLRFMQRDNIKPSSPVFAHLRWQPFLAWRGTRVVGRISAQVDTLVQVHRGENVGYFGMIEAEDDAATFAGLFAAAEQWLRDQGMAQVVGPFNLNINQEIGVLVEGFNTIPNMMMGHARPYYDRQIQALGYTPAKDLLCYEAPPDFVEPPILTLLKKRLAGRLVVRPLDPRNKLADFDTMRDIFNDAWANNWGSVPFTREEFRAIGSEMLLLIPADLVQIALVDDEPAAFIVLLPNLNEAIRDLGGKLLPFGWAKLLWRLKVGFPGTGRVPLMGVRQKYQQTRLGPGLAFAVIDAVRKIGFNRGIRTVEMSWVLEDNVGMRHIAEAIGGVINKRYRMYERRLTGPGSTLQPTARALAPS